MSKLDRVYSYWLRPPERKQDEDEFMVFIRVMFNGLMWGFALIVALAITAFGAFCGAALGLW